MGQQRFAAGIIMNLNGTTVFTHTDVCTIGPVLQFKMFRQLLPVPEMENTFQGMPDKNAGKYPEQWDYS